MLNRRPALIYLQRPCLTFTIKQAEKGGGALAISSTANVPFSAPMDYAPLPGLRPLPSASTIMKPRWNSEMKCPVTYDKKGYRLLHRKCRPADVTNTVSTSDGNSSSESDRYRSLLLVWSVAAH